MSLICGINNNNKEMQTHRHTERTSHHQLVEGRREGQDGGRIVKYKR